MGIKVKIIAGLSVLLLIGSLTLWAHMERSGRKAAEKEAETAQARLKDSERNRKIERALQSGVALIDQIQTERLRDAKAEIDDLRGRVVAGAVELRVGAECETPVPGDAGDSSVDTGGTARLDQESEQAYYDHRDGITRNEVKLKACQDILRELKNTPRSEG